MTEGGMVGVQGERAALEIDPPFLKSMDDGEEFLFVGGIIALGRVHLPGGECDRLESVALVLLKDGAHGEARCIRGDDEGECRVRDAENRSAGESDTEGVEGGLSLSGPGVWGVLVRELGERGGNAGVVGDEATVIIADA
jgi:hypothetical protein